MTIGTYAGVPLQDEADTWRHGAVFLLRKPPRRHAVVSLGGWTTYAVADVNAVITCGPSAASTFDETHTAALGAANNALDYMSAAGLCDAAIRHDSDDCLVWWRNGAGEVVIRARAVAFYPPFQANLTGVVRDAAGETVASPPPPTPSQHDAFRFIRMSRTSEYLFDSYRNMFLALESLLSDIRPPQRSPNGRYEGERAWFEEALRCADALVPVANLAPQGESDPVAWVLDNIYSAERSGLMHAKQGRPYLLPQDDAGREDLRRSLSTLSSYVRGLLTAHLSLPVGYGFSLAQYAWEKASEGLFQQCELFVSDDTSKVIQGDGNSFAADSTVIKVRFGDPDWLRPWVRAVLSASRPADLERLAVIGKMGAVSKEEGEPIVCVSELNGPLVLGKSVERFELEIGAGYTNPSEPPEFAS